MYKTTLNTSDNTYVVCCCALLLLLAVFHCHFGRLTLSWRRRMNKKHENKVLTAMEQTLSKKPCCVIMYNLFNVVLHKTYIGHTNTIIIFVLLNTNDNTLTYPSTIKHIFLGSIEVRIHIYFLRGNEKKRNKVWENLIKRVNLSLELKKHNIPVIEDDEWNKKIYGYFFLFNSLFCDDKKHNQTILTECGCIFQTWIASNTYIIEKQNKVRKGKLFFFLFWWR